MRIKICALNIRTVVTERPIPSNGYLYFPSRCSHLPDDKAEPLEQANLASMAIQLQWGLEQTSHSALQSATGLVRAASSDNVQALAILACEGLGATIPICPTTRLKIEHTVCQPVEPAVIGFLKATVGFSAGDCVSQLGQNQAGVQFLGLASTLVTVQPEEASRILLSMIESSARDKTLVPTSRHITRLLKTIHPRCLQAGFSEDVAGWQIMFERAIQSKLQPGGHELNRLSLRYHPPESGIEKLVDGLRQLHRIGETDITNMVVRTNPFCASWTVAFIKWCLGHPPPVTFRDETVLVRQDNSKVEVIIDHGEFEVKLHSSRTGLSTLVTSSGGSATYGMVRIRTYGDLFLRTYNIDDDFTKRAIHQALPYALLQVRNHAVVLADKLELSRAFHGTRIRDKLSPFQHLKLSPFPDESIIWTTCSKFLGTESTGTLRTLPEGLLTFDLPLFSLLYKNLVKRCRCVTCSRKPESVLPVEYCLKTKFFKSFCFLVADILSLSLFEAPEDLLLSTRNITSRKYLNGNFVFAIEQILATGSSFGCGISTILTSALDLVGHEKFAEDEAWVMSCYQGQAVWPALYETISITKSGFLRLLWLRGNLGYRGDTYHRVVGPKDTVSESHKPQREAVSEVCNLFPGIRLGWSVTGYDERLEASLAVKDPSGSFSSVTSCPTIVLGSLAEAILLEGCSHSPDTKLSTPDVFCQLVGPFSTVRDRGSQKQQDVNRLFATHLPFTAGEDDIVWEEPPEVFSDGTDGDEDEDGSSPERSEGPESNEDSLEKRVSIVAVSGCDDLRFITLSKNTLHLRVVIRGSSCLSCCLDLCRMSGFATLVL